mmetsp:Transcript_877/g.1807  ORF Transcript_877/g.1807 Transcript_877/m.1807 type:complete len:223 (+) Transcript_877:1048-1716(+)
MKNGIGRSTRHHDHANGILEGSLGHDITWFDVFRKQHLHRLTSLLTFIPLLLGVSGGARRIWERHTKSLNGGCHRVRRIHSTTRSRAWTTVLHNFLPFLLGDLIIQKLSVGLKGTDNVQLLSSTGQLPRTDGSTIHHNPRPVQPSHGNNHTGHIFITPRKSNEAIVPLSAHDGFDGIGNQITRLEGVAHSRCAHGDAVGYAHGVESEADAVGGYDALLDTLG